MPHFSFEAFGGNGAVAFVHTVFKAPKGKPGVVAMQRYRHMRRQGPSMLVISLASRFWDENPHWKDPKPIFFLCDQTHPPGVVG